MAPKWKLNPDDVDVPESSGPEPLLRPLAGGKRRPVPPRLKHKDRGFRIEKTTNGKRWTLEKYYRDEAAMRAAFLACRRRGRGEHSWHGYTYRMVFPDGKILPGIHDNRYSEYRRRWPDA
jgi:hypothetical protein